MSHLEKLKFPELPIDGSSYVVWALEAHMYLSAEGLEDTIKEDFNIPTGNTQKEIRKKASKALCFILKHLAPQLKSDYLTESNPSVVWKSLDLRFNTDRKATMLPILKDEWEKLKFQNFKTVSDYATELYRITNQLAYCGEPVTEEDKIHKTLTTFHPNLYVLTAQHRIMNHESFDKLVAHLLFEEKHQLLLLKNHDERKTPLESKPSKPDSTPEAHYSANGGKRNKKKKGAWRAKARRKWNPKNKKHDGRKRSPTSDTCHKCGLKGHWANECKTNDLHCKLYQRYKDEQSKGKRTDQDQNNKPRKQTSFMISDEKDDDEYESHCVEILLSERCDDNTICLVDSATTHAIFNNKNLFSNLNILKDTPNVKTLGGLVSIIKGEGEVKLTLPNGTHLSIAHAFYAPTASRNLLGFTNFRANGYHINTHENQGEESLEIRKDGQVVEECPGTGKGLYKTNITAEKSSQLTTMYTEKVNLAVWHDRLGHPGVNMLRKILTTTRGIQYGPRGLNDFLNQSCGPCMMGKLPNQKKQSFSGIKYKPKSPGDLWLTDTCGPISPPCGPFHYYMVIKDAAGPFKQTHLLMSKNQVMPKLLISIIHFKAHFPQYPIKNIRVDNAAEYLSTTFQRFCESNGTNLQASVPHAHNTGAENMVKQIQMVARPMLLRSNLPVSCWGHAVLHASDLLQYHSSSNSTQTPYQHLNGFAPDLSHLRTFGSAVYVPIPPNKRSKFDPKRQLGIYIGFESPSILRYLDPITGDSFVAHISMCKFNENLFPRLSTEEQTAQECGFKFDQPDTVTLHKDPYNGQGEKEVRRILHLQGIANNAPHVFAPTERITRSDINQAANYPARVQIDSTPAHVMDPLKKRGRPAGAKDLIPRKRRTKEEITSESRTLVESLPTAVDVYTSIVENRGSDDPDTIAKCRASPDWSQWKDAINLELNSLSEQQVFGEVQECPDGFTPIGSKWVFTRKRNPNGSINRHKARLVAQGFTQRPGVDYSDTYSPVMSMSTL